MTLPVQTPKPRFQTYAEMEAAYIRDLITFTDGYLHEAARVSGLSRTTIWRKRKALGLPIGNNAGKRP